MGPVKKNFCGGKVDPQVEYGAWKGAIRMNKMTPSLTATYK